MKSKYEDQYSTNYCNTNSCSANDHCTVWDRCEDNHCDPYVNNCAHTHTCGIDYPG